MFEKLFTFQSPLADQFCCSRETRKQTERSFYKKMVYKKPDPPKTKIKKLRGLSSKIEEHFCIKNKHFANVLLELNANITKIKKLGRNI